MQKYMSRRMVTMLVIMRLLTELELNLEKQMMALLGTM